MLQAIFCDKTVHETVLIHFTKLCFNKFIKSKSATASDFDIIWSCGLGTNEFIRVYLQPIMNKILKHCTKQVSYHPCTFFCECTCEIFFYCF